MDITNYKTDDTFLSHWCHFHSFLSRILFEGLVEAAYQTCLFPPVLRALHCYIPNTLCRPKCALGLQSDRPWCLPLELLPSGQGHLTIALQLQDHPSNGLSWGVLSLTPADSPCWCFCMCVLVCQRRISCRPDWPQTYYVAKDDPELLTLPWNYGYGPPGSCQL